MYSGVAMRLMRGMGWRGGGLGVAGREGREEPVKASGVRGTTGLGYEPGKKKRGKRSGGSGKSHFARGERELRS